MKIYGHLLLLKFNKKMRLSEFGDGRWGKSLVDWILDTGYWLLDSGHWSLYVHTGCSILVTGCWMLDAGEI